MKAPNNSNEALLEVENLCTEITTRTGKILVVDHVSFSVNAGETLGIVGESGSGKSMLALSLLRLVPKPVANVVSGRVVLNGEDLLTKNEADMRAVRGRKISMILQDPQTSLNPSFTVGNQIVEALQVHRRDSTKNLTTRAIDVLNRVRVAAPASRIHDFPHQMSGGMRQRVVGAIAISCEPQVIIADEPTTSLDVTIQAQYLKLLQEIQAATGLALIFITHDLGIVAKICHNLMVMYAGRVLEAGPVREIFNHPSHPYTRALLASVPKLSANVHRLYSIEGQPPAIWDMPSGCRFAPRCQYVEERCRSEYPPSSKGKSGHPQHVVSCWRSNEL